MKTIKIFGTNSSKYEYFKYELFRRLKLHGIEVPIVEINDIDQIVAEGVESIPTLRINNHIDLACPENRNINEFVKETLQVVLKEFNYGNMKKILVPIDFSDTSANAYSYAKKLATKLKAAITLAHYYHPTLDTNFSNYKKDAEGKLKEMVKPNAYLGASFQNDVYVDTIAESGLAADEIIKVSGNYDLVVMGTSGAGEGIKRWFGSVSSRVSNEASCPVLFIPPEARYKDLQGILYPVKDTIRQFDQVSWLLSILDADLHMVHFDTNEIHSPLMRQVFGDNSSLISSKNPWHVIYKSRKCEQIDEGIKTYINDEPVDLIILEKGKEHFLELLLHRSVTRKLTGQIDVPVLVLNQKCKGMNQTDCDEEEEYKIPIPEIKEKTA